VQARLALRVPSRLAPVRPRRALRALAPARALRVRALRVPVPAGFAPARPLRALRVLAPARARAPVPARLVPLLRTAAPVRAPPALLRTAAPVRAPPALLRARCARARRASRVPLLLLQPGVPGADLSRVRALEPDETLVFTYVFLVLLF